jgi:hypothetical protein
MGFWGSFVLCRTDAALDEVAAIASRDEGLEEADHLGGGWQVGRYSGSFLADDADGMLNDLIAETGAPALTGFVLDSDCIDVHGRGSRSGHWHACLARASMARYVKEDGVDFDWEFLRPQAAADRAAAWAREARLDPDEPALLDVFSRPDGDLFAEPLFYALIRALGINESTPPPAQAPRRRPRAVRRSRRPTNPLDAFIYDFATPLLTEAGFVRKGRTFRFTNDLGDEAAIMFRPVLGYLLDAGVTHKPLCDRVESRPEYLQHWPWHRQWSSDGETGAALGRPSETRAWQHAGQRLRDLLRQQVLPALTRMLDRAVFVDVMRRGLQVVGNRGPAAEALLLADLGPSLALDDALTRLHDDDAAARVHDRLAAQGTSGDAWRAQVQATRAHLDAVLAQYVTPALAAAGFGSTKAGYRRESKHGDAALIDISLSATAAPGRAPFYIDTGFLPAAEIERRTESWISGPVARGSWYWRTVEPPDGYDLNDGPLTELDAHAWLLTDEHGGGPQLAALLTTEATRLTPCLDRAILRQHVLHHDDFAQKIIVLLDGGPSEQLESNLRRAESHMNHDYNELAAWARRKLGSRSTPAR